MNYNEWYQQCIVNNFCKSLLVSSAPKPLKTRAEALWLCRFPASSDLLASPKMQKRKAPEPVCCVKQCPTQGPCYQQALEVLEKQQSGKGRNMKKKKYYQTVYEFQEDFPTKAEREERLKIMPDSEIDQLIRSCGICWHNGLVFREKARGCEKSHSLFSCNKKCLYLLKNKGML